MAGGNSFFGNVEGYSFRAVELTALIYLSDYSVTSRVTDRPKMQFVFVETAANHLNRPGSECPEVLDSVHKGI